MYCKLTMSDIEEEYTNRVAREIPHYHVDVEWFPIEPKELSLEWYMRQACKKKKVHKWWVDEAKRELGIVHGEWIEGYRYRINYIEDIDLKAISIEEFQRQCEELGIINEGVVECCDMVYKWDYEYEDYRWMVEPVM